MWAVHAVCRAVALSSAAGHCDHCFLENREREDRERGAGAGGGGHFPDCIIMCEAGPGPVSVCSPRPGPSRPQPEQPAPAAHRLAPAANNFDSDVFSRNFD